MNLPTNKTFSCKRRTATVLTNLPALCIPASDQIAAMQGAPANRLFEITFDATYDVQEQDVLTNQADATDAFRVKSLKKFLTPRLGHTYVIAEGLWGSA